ncbi:TetR/AcrR family transcriptional regulator [Saccharothrix yanglingensis]|uniref:TetR family transcriptional regulator n=1 Tax=Saccharothrix yanglingensis TaxID=659496 RepID=A0ABU0X025_9PSEU|nr:TetR/AcrR family transcriptional regulator [Saccharothrix yanglingensis]MDQ2585475.1 TetR family transcriptional regulator [Saccharothrix yanglingensis]
MPLPRSPLRAPHRSDARRNRAAIMRAAGEQVALGRPMPSLRQLADATGLGQATVYRHFSDRRALLLAVTREQVAVLRRVAERDADDPAAFRALLRGVLVHQVSMRPLVDELRRLPRPDQLGQVRGLLDALRAPFARSQAAGHLKGDVVLDDLPIVFTMLQAAVDSAPDPGTARRAIPVLLDGLFHARP